MSKEPIHRGWMPYALAARDYVGVSPDLFLGAIKRQELRAYKKPLTRGRTAADPEKQRDSYFVCLPDVDEWIRTYWVPAAAAS